MKNIIGILPFSVTLRLINKMFLTKRWRFKQNISML